MNWLKAGLAAWSLWYSNKTDALERRVKHLEYEVHVLKAVARKQKERVDDLEEIIIQWSKHGTQERLP